jgi:hypothetical protein
VRGTKASTELGPTIVGNVRNSATFNDWSPRWAIGNLNGLYGYVADTYGVAMGVPTGAWIKIDPTNGVRIGFNATTNIQLTAAGAASFVGAITAASGAIGGWTIGATDLVGGAGAAIRAGQTAHNTGTGFWLGTVGGVVKFSVGNPAANSLTWDGTNLALTGAINAISGTIGNWAIGATTISAVGLTLTNGGSSGAIATKITVGAGTYNDAGTPFYVDGTGRVSFGTTLRFDPGASTFLTINDLTISTLLTVGTAIHTNGFAFGSSGGALFGSTQQLLLPTRGAAVAHATNATDVITQLNALIDRLSAAAGGHGLIA